MLPSPILVPVQRAFSLTLPPHGTPHEEHQPFPQEQPTIEAFEVLYICSLHLHYFCARITFVCVCVCVCAGHSSHHELAPKA